MTNFQITATTTVVNDANVYSVAVKGLDSKVNATQQFKDPLKAMRYMFMLSKRLKLSINRLDLVAVSLDYQRAKQKAMEAAIEQEQAVESVKNAISEVNAQEAEPQPVPQPLQLEFKSEEQSPLMKQWSELKQKHPDALLLFRCGDFYETYNEDAEKASKILGITLTERSNHAEKMAGFPYHALDTYLPKLIHNGCRVAICDEIEEKPKAKRGRKSKKEEA